MSKVIKILEEELTNNRLSRQGLARASGLSDSTVTKIMNDNLKISVDTCARIAIALSLDPLELLKARVDDEIDELSAKINYAYNDARRV